VPWSFPRRTITAYQDRRSAGGIRYVERRHRSHDSDVVVSRTNSSGQREGAHHELMLVMVGSRSTTVPSQPSQNLLPGPAVLRAEIIYIRSTPMGGRKLWPLSSFRNARGYTGFAIGNLHNADDEVRSPPEAHTCVLSPPPRYIPPPRSGPAPPCSSELDAIAHGRLPYQLPRARPAQFRQSTRLQCAWWGSAGIVPRQPGVTRDLIPAIPTGGSATGRPTGSDTAAWMRRADESLALSPSMCASPSRRANLRLFCLRKSGAGVRGPECGAAAQVTTAGSCGQQGRTPRRGSASPSSTAIGTGVADAPASRPVTCGGRRGPPARRSPSPFARAAGRGCPRTARRCDRRRPNVLANRHTPAQDLLGRRSPGRCVSARAKPPATVDTWSTRKLASLSPSSTRGLSGGCRPDHGQPRIWR